MSGRIAWLAALGALVAGSSAQAASECAPADIASLAEWEGVWATEGTDAAAEGLSGRSGQADFKLLGLSAPWNDAGWSRMAAVIQRGNGGDDKSDAWGFPMMMASYSEFAFIVSPTRTAIVNQYRDVRTIYTDMRGHMPEDEIWATNWGDSIGCWEGDTLVVDTVAVRFDPVLNVFAPPLSEQAHFIERIRMVAPGRLENEMTITDPVYLTAPWTVRITYIPAGLERLVLDAFDDRNDTSGQTIVTSGRADFAGVPLPENLALSDAQLDTVAGVYQVDGGPVEIAIERRGDRLFLRPPGLEGGLLMFAKGPLEFVSLSGDEMRFVTDAAGRVTSVVLAGQQGPATATRKAT